MSKNTGMIERTDRMINENQAQAGKFVPPYAVSYELGSFLRSATQPIR